MKIKFYEKVDDEKLLFAVIVAKYKEQWVFCKHKQRNMNYAADIEKQMSLFWIVQDGSFMKRVERRNIN